MRIRELPKAIEQIFDENYQFYGCTTGDCPHQTQEECNKALLGEGALEVLERAEKLVEALKVISSNGEGRGMGWTPAQHARIVLSDWQAWKDGTN